MDKAVCRNSQKLTYQQISENKARTLKRKNGFESFATKVHCGMTVAFESTSLTQLESLLSLFHTSKRHLIFQKFSTMLLSHLADALEKTEPELCARYCRKMC